MTTPEIVSCHCEACGNVVCFSSNEWTKISSTYSTYVNATFFSQSGLELVEPKRPGSKDSELEGCYVQPLRCEKCKTGIGLKCVEAPPGKTANLDRSFLKLTKLLLKSIAASTIVEARIIASKTPALATIPNFNRVSRLNESQLASTKRTVAPSSSSSPLATPANKPQLSTTQQVNSSPNMVVVDTEEVGHPSDVSRELGNQRRDINRILEAIDSLKDDISALKGCINDIQMTQPESFGEEIQLLTENVSGISKGVSEIAGLKFEIRMMQQRLKRLEEAKSIKRMSFGAVDFTSDPSPTSTPILNAKASPYQTPRNQNISRREVPLSSTDFGSRSSGACPERQSSEHPLRNVEHLSIGPRSRDEIEMLPGASQPLSHQLLPENPCGAADDARGRFAAETRASSTSSTLLDQRSADHQPSIAVDYGEIFPKATPPAPPMQTTVPNGLPKFVIKTQDASSISDPETQKLRVQQNEVEIIKVQPHITAPQARMASDIQPAISTSADLSNPNPQRRRQRRGSTPKYSATPEREIPDRQGTPAPKTERGRTKRRKTAAFDEVGPNSVFDQAPHPSLEGAGAQSARSLSSEKRNEEGLLLKRDGKVDGRSIRYRFRGSHEKRSHRLREGLRDTEGYLLRPDGARDARSVRVLDSARKKREETEQTVGAIPTTLPSHD